MTTAGEMDYFSRSLPEEIPSGYESCKLSVVCSLKNGDSLPTGEREDGSVPVFGSNGIVGNHTESNTSAPVLIVGRKGSAGEVNFSEEPAFVIDTAYYISQEHVDCDVRWLYYLLRSLDLEQHTEHSAVPGINRRFIEEHRIVLPNKKIQEEIVEFLRTEESRIDSSIESLIHLRDLIKERKEIVTSDLVTSGLSDNCNYEESGVDWIGEIPEDWDIAKIGWLLKEPPKNGLSPSLTSRDQGIPTFSISAVQDGIVDLDGNIKYTDISEEKAAPYFIKEGDILLIRGNGNLDIVGRCGVVQPPVPENCIYPDILIRLNFKDKLCEKYMVYLLNSHCLRPQIEIGARTSTGVWKISQKTLSDLEVPVPPVHEQKQVAEVLDKVANKCNSLIDQISSTIELFEEKRQALITAAVTGQIDVPEAQGESQDLRT